MTVDWAQRARDRLADIWVQIEPPDRDRIEQCVHRINAQLAADPWGLGESREDVNHRVWFSHPLVVWFWLVQGRPEVIVTHVAALRPRQGGG